MRGDASVRQRAFENKSSLDRREEARCLFRRSKTPSRGSHAAHERERKKEEQRRRRRHKHQKRKGRSEQRTTKKKRTHFSCSIFASCNFTTAFVQCVPQSMPYFSFKIARFFVLLAATLDGTTIVKNVATARTRSEKEENGERGEERPRWWRLFEEKSDIVFLSMLFFLFSRKCARFLRV